MGRIMVRRRFRFHTAHVRSVRITASGSCHLTQPKTREGKLNLLSDAVSSRTISAGREKKSPLFHVQMRDYNLRTSAAEG